MCALQTTTNILLNKEDIFMALPQIARLLGGLFAGGLIGSTIASGIVRGGNEANSIHDEARTQNQNSSAGVTPEAPKTPEELQAEIDKLTAARDSIIRARETEELAQKFEQQLEQEEIEKYNRLEQQLAPYGIEPYNVMDVFDNAKEVEIDGKKHLVLTSKVFHLELEVPLDETFQNPSEMQVTTEEFGQIHLQGFNGTLKKTEVDNLDGWQDITIESGNIKYIGKYGNRDIVTVKDGAVVEFVTDDWADQVYVEEDSRFSTDYELQPGTYKFPDGIRE